jgi:hypothetical protein
MRFTPNQVREESQKKWDEGYAYGKSRGFSSAMRRVWFAGLAFMSIGIALGVWATHNPRMLTLLENLGIYF